MNLGRFSNGKNSKAYGNAILSLNQWSDLNSLEPAQAGYEVFIESGIPGASVSGRVLARRGNVKWDVPGADTSTINYLNNNQIPAPLLPSFYKNSAYLSPGGLNLYTTTGEIKAYTIPIHLYDGVGIGKIRFGGWNTNETSWDIRRLYIAQRNASPTITENLSTGWVTVINSPVSVSALGTATNPKITWVAEIDVTGIVGDFAIHIEVNETAELRTWGAGGYSVGYGAALDGTNWAIQGVTAIPSSGSFDPYSYSGFTASNLPNIIISCENLTRDLVQPVVIGDSIAQGYGSIDSFMGKSGLAYEWFQSWQTNDLPYVPLQLGWQGYSSIMIRQLFTALRRELGAMPTFLEGATINNWNNGYNISNPGLQNINDLGLVPYIVWLGFGWDILGAGATDIRTCYDTIETLYTSASGKGLYGNEVCGVMDVVTMLYLSGKSADGGHPNGQAWIDFAAANYSGATSFMATIL